MVCKREAKYIMAICGFDYAVRIILLYLYVLHKYDVLNMYAYLCICVCVSSFHFDLFRFTLSHGWLGLCFFICFFCQKNIRRIAGCRVCISHASAGEYTRKRVHLYARLLARTHANHIVSFMLSLIKYLHKHAEYLTRLSLDLCTCASFSCILFITHRLFFDFRCLTAQSAYTHTQPTVCCDDTQHSENTNISTA